MSKISKNIKKMAISILVLSSMSHVSIYASPNKDTKTTISELLDEPEKLFLASEVPYIDSKASFLLNADTGQVLYTEDGEYSLPILSVTKALAAYVVFDKLNEGNPDFTLDTKVIAKGRPVLVSYEYNFSNVSLYEDSEYTVRELLEATLINSANGALMLLGQHIAGGEAEFVALMRKKIESLGLKQSTVFTSTGLTREDLLEYGYDELEEGTNSMSSADIAYMVMHFIKEYPKVLEITSMTKGIFASGTTDPFEYDTTIALLDGQEYAYPGVDGFKTGGDLPDYTSTIVFTAVQNDTRLIGVILGAKNADVRSEEAHKLLDYGFKNLYHKTFIAEDSKIFKENGTLNTKYGSKNSVMVAVDRPLAISSSFSDLEPEFVFIPTNSKYDETYDTFNGVIKKGEVLGKIVVEYDDLNFLTRTDETQYSVNVIAMEDIDNGFFLFNFFEWLKDGLLGLF